MNFGQSISHCFSNYFNFNGRGSRSEFWWATEGTKKNNSYGKPIKLKK